IQQDALGGAVEIVILAAAECPHEDAEADAAEGKGDRHEVEKVVHHTLLPAAARDMRNAPGFDDAARRPPLSRKALAMTISEDSDIATAATRGVTWPSTAMGTATTL